MKYLLSLILVSVMCVSTYATDCFQNVNAGYGYAQNVRVVQRVVVPQQRVVVKEFVEVPQLQVVVRENQFAKVQELRIVEKQQLRNNNQNLNIRVNVNNRRGLFRR